MANHGLLPTMCKAFDFPHEAQLAAAFSRQYMHFQDVVRTHLDAGTTAFAFVPINNGPECSSSLFAIFDDIPLQGARSLVLCADEIDEVPNVLLGQDASPRGHDYTAVGNAIGEDSIREDRRPRNTGEVFGLPRQASRRWAVTTTFRAVTHGTGAFPDSGTSTDRRGVVGHRVLRDSGE